MTKPNTQNKYRCCGNNALSEEDDSNERAKRSSSMRGKSPIIPTMAETRRLAPYQKNAPKNKPPVVQKSPSSKKSSKNTTETSCSSANPLEIECMGYPLANMSQESCGQYDKERQSSEKYRNNQPYGMPKGQQANNIPESNEQNKRKSSCMCSMPTFPPAAQTREFNAPNVSERPGSGTYPVEQRIVKPKTKTSNQYDSRDKELELSSEEWPTRVDITIHRPHGRERYSMQCKDLPKNMLAILDKVFENVAGNSGELTQKDTSIFKLIETDTIEDGANENREKKAGNKSTEKKLPNAEERKKMNKKYSDTNVKERKPKNKEQISDQGEKERKEFSEDEQIFMKQLNAELVFSADDRKEYMESGQKKKDRALNQTEPASYNSTRKEYMENRQKGTRSVLDPSGPRVPENARKESNERKQRPKEVKPDQSVPESNQRLQKGLSKEPQNAQSDEVPKYYSDGGQQENLGQPGGIYCIEIHDETGTWGMEQPSEEADGASKDPGQSGVWMTQESTDLVICTTIPDEFFDNDEMMKDPNFDPSSQDMRQEPSKTDSQKSALISKELEPQEEEDYFVPDTKSSKEMDCCCSGTKESLAEMEKIGAVYGEAPRERNSKNIPVSKYKSDALGKQSTPRARNNAVPNKYNGPVAKAQPPANRTTSPMRSNAAPGNRVQSSNGMVPPDDRQCPHERMNYPKCNPNDCNADLYAAPKRPMTSYEASKQRSSGAQPPRQTPNNEGRSDSKRNTRESTCGPPAPADDSTYCYPPSQSTPKHRSDSRGRNGRSSQQ